MSKGETADLGGFFFLLSVAQTHLGPGLHHCDLYQNFQLALLVKSGLLTGTHSFIVR